MREAHPLFDVLCKSADADCATALERLVHEAPDRRLNRINVLDFARREGLNEQRTMTTFLHATQSTHGSKTSTGLIVTVLGTGTQELHGTGVLSAGSVAVELDNEIAIDIVHGFGASVLGYALERGKAPNVRARCPTHAQWRPAPSRDRSTSPDRR